MSAKKIAMNTSGMATRHRGRRLVVQFDGEGEMGNLSRKPTSNESPVGSENPWLEETELMDKIALLLAGMAKRCVNCKRACRLKHLSESGHCPDCFV